MTNSQFQILVGMFNTLNQRIEDVRTELKQDMDEGFARQEAISHEILNAMGQAHANLEADFQTTKTAQNKRLSRLEKRFS